MLMKVLTTNHGKHSDEKLGFAIADDIVDVAAAANAGDSMDARRLANQIGDFLTVRTLALRQKALSILLNRWLQTRKRLMPWKLKFLRAARRLVLQQVNGSKVTAKMLPVRARTSMTSFTSGCATLSTCTGIGMRGMAW
jgi:hypothetical protein